MYTSQENVGSDRVWFLKSELVLGYETGGPLHFPSLIYAQTPGSSSKQAH